MRAADHYLAEWLAGKAPPALPDVSESLIAARLSYHGVAGLLNVTADRAPGALTQRIREEAVAQLHHQRLGDAMLADVLDACHAAGIRTLLIKGAALALTLYDRPEHRQRSDTDIWVDRSDFDRAAMLLQNLGFESQISSAGRSSARAQSFVRQGNGTTLEIDLHGRFSNAPVIAGLFGFEEIYGRGSRLPRFAVSTRVPSTVDALLIAAIHRRVHLKSPYFVEGSGWAGDRLIWLKDIDLLACAARPETEALVARARARGIGPAVKEALDAAGTVFGEALQTPLDWGAPGPALRYLEATHPRRFLTDLMHEPGLSGRLQLLRDFALPPGQYMRARFGEGWLPALYLARLARALRRVGRAE